MSQSVDLTQVEEPAARDLLWDFSRMRTDSEEAAWAGALLADGPSPDGEQPVEVMLAHWACLAWTDVLESMLMV